MATYGHTFTSGDTLTPTKLNNARTVTDIVNADVSASAEIHASKLAGGSILDAQINANAQIALSKLATGALPAAITVASANLVDGTIATADIANAAVTTAKLAAVTAQSLLPAGAVMPFAQNAAPAGWLTADGSAVSRSTYSALYAVLLTTYGAGDGSETFNLPDLRGIFVRGSDSQTISGTTYSGTYAAKQQDAFKTHNHAVTDPGHSHNIQYYQSTGGGTAAANAQVINSAIGVTASATTGITINNTGDTETRPANIALRYCIKF